MILYKAMNTIIGLKQLRESVEEYAQQVKRGKSFIVVRRSKPLFRITPLVPLNSEEGQWEEVIDFTKIKKGGVHVDDLLKRL
ncbi:MAG: hypothetical protein A3H42_05965 [Deltaproteobacteria bacterium RIFCSPLOWO2_02_FULL_46_8]|nr:MAG: hypothetical protein A3H42_05965 [Deltaproteobacteria bacterium RIFCSPLOWO2_02_FULL_46_8]